jgi:uncharacterized protein (TIGR02186 family)
MKPLVQALLFLAGLALAAPVCAGESFVVVPEPRQVDITPGFAGADITAFGTVPASGDLVIKVIGPQQEVALSRETRMGPFWVSGGKTEVGAPSLLYIYATRPIESILPSAEQDRHGLRLEDVPVHLEPQLLGDSAADWRKAFFRLKENEHRYREDDHAIHMVGDRLFLTHIPLPGDLQVGTYRIETLLVRNGRVVERSSGQFEVRQVGIERWVWKTAHEQPWLFGVLFTLAAIALGFALNFVFNRSR